MTTLDLAAVHDFIIRAKAATYVGNGQKLLPYRLGSHDLQFVDGDWAYHDSYVGESDFIGEEIVYFQRQVVWGMNYFGYLLQPDRISSAQAGHVIRVSLTRLYQEGRFLGGFAHIVDGLRYVDTNEGDVQLFHGKEWIEREGQIIYELRYHGGLIKN
ncbi:MAG TPA: DUF5680 domain-containing protein [Anaerolineae bacterium]|nr:DUF5680 domain-containing protein [Anaerolineae bacterium]